MDAKTSTEQQSNSGLTNINNNNNTAFEGSNCLLIDICSINAYTFKPQMDRCAYSLP